MRICESRATGGPLHDAKVKAREDWDGTTQTDKTGRYTWDEVRGWVWLSLRAVATRKTCLAIKANGKRCGRSPGTYDRCPDHRT